MQRRIGGGNWPLYTSSGSRIKQKRFDTIEEAFLYYKTEKEKVIRSVAHEYYEKGLITNKVYVAMSNYIVEKSD
jgi:hypothetical protein